MSGNFLTQSSVLPDCWEWSPTAYSHAMNRKEWARPASWRTPEKRKGELGRTICENNENLLQARRTETQLTADPAPRCGFSLRGIEELIRGAGSCGRQPAGLVLKVRWRREVAWQKVIEVSEA